jgi:hypothetical protein
MIFLFFMVCWNPRVFLSVRRYTIFGLFHENISSTATRSFFRNQAYWKDVRLPDSRNKIDFPAAEPAKLLSIVTLVKSIECTYIYYIWLLAVCFLCESVWALLRGKDRKSRPLPFRGNANKVCCRGSDFNTVTRECCTGRGSFCLQLEGLQSIPLDPRRGTFRIYIGSL